MKTAKWKITKVSSEDAGALQVVLDAGWEPFAVTPGNWAAHPIIWLRRPVEDAPEERD
jgi:hypothetical protein